ncbi:MULTISPECIES: hypothetical protein [Pontibacillus]|uniref:hypothetical protein n=1 Tax=Pontibacillus TaxID=289201 RepID=UPI0004869811|nr:MULTISPECIES: hypothetical protein [Pontibacillus]QHE50873.1 hypothetical protein GS400_01925 [Pontibacillus sp. HMF3514]
MKFKYYNDTGRNVSIHPGTKINGTMCSMEHIKPQEERTFHLPENTYPWVKMWDNGKDEGLSILVSPQKDKD